MELPATKEFTEHVPDTTICLQLMLGQALQSTLQSRAPVWIAQLAMLAPMTTPLFVCLGRGQVVCYGAKLRESVVEAATTSFPATLWGPCASHYGISG